MSAKPTDAQILTAMGIYPAGVFTYTIAFLLRGLPELRTLKTAAVLTRMRRLERAGVVEKVGRWQPGCHMEWKIK